MTHDSYLNRRDRKFAGERSVHLITAFLLCGVIACNRQQPGNDLSKAGDQRKPVPASNAAGDGDSNERLQTANSFGPVVMFDAPQFELTDQLGTAFGAKESAGYVWVANFMFTRCTATCPRQTAKFEELQRRASRWDEWERIRLVSFTVDPENDTVERLREYAEIHHADPQHWKFLTGERADLWALSKDGFKLPVSNSATDTSVPITHSPLFFLVDSHGRIRGYYDGLSEDDFGKLLRDLRSVLSESPANSDETTHLAIPNELFDRRWLEQRRDDQLATANQLRVRHDFSFDDRVEESGIRFLNRAVSDAARDFKQNHYDHANGIAVADVDGDGLHDLYFLNQVSGGELWRNLGQGRFENTTEQAGVALAGRVAVSASFADTDNDGDPDLFVTTTRHGNAFFENNGQGHFTDATVKSGLEHVGHSSSADFFDYDRDGRLDLFLTNVGVFTTDEIGYSRDREKQDHPYFIGTDSAFAGHLFAERSEQSILYHNEGGNLFRDVSKETGLVDNGWSGDATPLDANDDGWTDLYVVNMQGNDEYYENVEGKRFERRGSQVFPNSVWGGMCVKSFDYNNDGLMDLFITNMHADMWQPWRDINGPQEKKKPRDDAVPPKSYLRSRGTGKNVFGNGFYEKQGPDLFREVSDQINAENYWPWGHSVGDLNADGFQDVFITSCMNFTFRYQTNSLLLNDHGNTFVDAEFILGVEPRRDGRVVTPWFELDCSGADKDHPECAGQSGRVVAWGALGSRSSVIFDLDQDGDLDIVTNDFNSPPMVLTSNLSEQKETLHFLKIQLRGTRSNRDGLSARVQVTIGDKVFTQVHDGQSGYISQSSLPLYFGLGDADVVDHISVQWLGGDLQEIAGPIPANQQLLIVEPDSPR